MNRLIKTSLLDELILTSSELFDHEEKWRSFLELASVQPNIMQIWYDRAYAAICNFSLSEEWDYYLQGDRIIWYLKDQSKDAITIQLQKELFYLYANSTFYDTYAIQQALEQERFAPLYNSLKKKDPDYFCLPGERGKYRFGAVYDDQFDGDMLAWYAGNRTEDFVSQVQQKLLPLMSRELSELIRELNNMSKRTYFF